MRQKLQLGRGTYGTTIQKAALQLWHVTQHLMTLTETPSSSTRKGKTRKNFWSTSGYIKALFSVNHPPEYSFQKNEEKGGEHKEPSCVSLTLLHHLFLLWMIAGMLRNDIGWFQALNEKEAQVPVFIPGWLEDPGAVWWWNTWQVKQRQSEASDSDRCFYTLLVLIRFPASSATAPPLARSA